MAKRVMPASLWIVALTAAAAACNAHAQGLSDPTRPPAMSAMVGGVAAAPSKAPGLQLQSILISPERKIAVINGETVPLGGRIGNAVLSAISGTSVTLRRGTQLETLRLLPDVTKKPADTSTGRIEGKGETR